MFTSYKHENISLYPLYHHITITKKGTCIYHVPINFISRFFFVFICYFYYTITTPFCHRITWIYKYFYGTGRLNALQNSWNELINSVVQSDDLKFIVNLLDGITQSVTNLIKPLGTLGTFGTIGLGAGLFAGVKNFGKTYKRMNSNCNCFEYALYT